MLPCCQKITHSKFFTIEVVGSVSLLVHSNGRSIMAAGIYSKV